MFDAATGWSVVVTRFSSQATRDIHVQIAFHLWGNFFKLREAFKSQVD